MLRSLQNNRSAFTKPLTIPTIELNLRLCATSFISHSFCFDLNISETCFMENGGFVIAILMNTGLVVGVTHKTDHFSDIHTSGYNCSLFLVEE